jgi:flagellar hook-associated protein 2
MNTDDVISKILEAESVGKNQQIQRKAQVQAKQDAWTKIRASLQTIRSKLDVLRFPSNFRYRSATIDDDSIASVAAAPGTTLGNHTLTVTKLATADKLWTTMSVADPAQTAVGVAGTLNIKVASGTQTFPITVLATDTLNSLKDKINKAGAGVSADVVKVVNTTGTSYQLTLTSKTLGSDGQITLTETPASGTTTVLGDTGLQFIKNGVWNETTPKNAVFSLDGQDYNMSTNTISDAIPGLTITLKKAQSGSDPLPTMGISVGIDPAPTVKAVQDWASAVNDLFSQLKTSTAYNTDSKLSGPLAGDFLARTIEEKIRSIFSARNGTLPTSLNQLSQVGITTGAFKTDDFGKVLVDADKLSAQIMQDPDGVARVFGALTDVTTTTNSSSTVNPMLNAKDMYTYVNSLLAFQQGALDTTTSSLSDTIKDIDNRISDMDDKLANREQELRAQFTRMEQAMSSLQTQGNAFMSQINGLLSSNNQK